MDTGFGGLPKGSTKSGVCGIVGMQIQHIGHLNYEKNVCATAGFCQFGQLLQMLGAALGGCVRKGADTIGFQGDTFDFQKTGFAIFYKRKVKAGIAVAAFRDEVFNMPKSTGEQPFFGAGIGCLGIHIDKALAFFDGDQIIPGFAGGR